MKQVGRLTDTAITGALKPGMHPDGDGQALGARALGDAFARLTDQPHHRPAIHFLGPSKRYHFMRAAGRAIQHVKGGRQQAGMTDDDVHFRVASRSAPCIWREGWNSAPWR